MAVAPSDPILLLRRTRTSRCGSSLPVSGVSAANVQYTSKGLREGGERTRDEGKRERETEEGGNTKRKTCRMKIDKDTHQQEKRNTCTIQREEKDRLLLMYHQQQSDKIQKKNKQ